MARIAIEMPRLGYDMETGIVAAWVKQVGDMVARGDVLAEIETEKSHGGDGGAGRRHAGRADPGAWRRRCPWGRSIGYRVGQPEHDR